MTTSPTSAPTGPTTSPTPNPTKSPLTIVPTTSATTLAPTNPPTTLMTTTPTTMAPMTTIPTSMTSITTIQMDVTMTSNIDCSQNNNTATTNIIQISVMSGMNAQLQSSGVVMLSITVYQICGGSVRRNLQSTESDIKFYGVATAACGNCGTQLGQLTEAALVTIVSDGSLSDSIKNNSGGAITLDISGAVVNSFETISNPPTPAPNGSKSAKDTKNSKTEKPVNSKSAKSSKDSKKKI